jgi:perosamine synthetase
MIRIYEPLITEKTKEYALDAINSGWISSQGEYIEKASNKLKEILGTDNLFLISNGTTATHCVSKSINLKYPLIDKLIVPNNVYVAAWNSFLLDKTFKSLLAVDCDLDTWNYDLQQLEEVLDKTDFNTTALLVVHNLGNIIDVPKIKEKYPKLVIVEDNCEGLFGKYGDDFSGTKSFSSSVSFFGNKNITSGEGGAVIVNDKDTFDYLRSFISQGTTSRRFVHDKIAHNYRMTNVQAALLYGQLESLEQILAIKKNIFNRYMDGFSDSKVIKPQTILENTKHANWMFGVSVNGTTYEELSAQLMNNGIETRPMFYCFTEHKYLNHLITTYHSNVNAIKLNQSSIVLPSHPLLTNEQIDYIIKTVKHLLGE